MFRVGGCSGWFGAWDKVRSGLCRVWGLKFVGIHNRLALAGVQAGVDRPWDCTY